jgi:hypothetical protein
MRTIHVQGEEAKERAVAAFSEELAAQRERLLSGRPPDEDETDATAEPDVAQAAQEAASAKGQQTLDELNEKLSDFRKLLTPRQSAQIDWRNPSAGPEAAQAQRRQEARERAMLFWAQQTLTRVRYFPLERYILEKEVLIDDFLRPIVRPFTPQYARARALMERLVEQVRLASEADWPARRSSFARTLVEGLNLAPPAQEEDRGDTRAELLAFFTAEGTADLIRKMAAATEAEEEASEAEAEGEG